VTVSISTWKELCVRCARICLLLSGVFISIEVTAQTQRPLAVNDVIGMTRLVNSNYESGDASNKNIAQFSPDGSRFVIILRKGNIIADVNEYSLNLYEIGPKKSALAHPLVRMCSSSNRAAIQNVRWLDDNRTITFLGENAGESPQIYSIDINSRRLRRLTSQVSPILEYQVSRNGQELVYLVAKPSHSNLHSELSSGKEVVIENQSLLNLLTGNTTPDSTTVSLFKKALHSPAAEIGSGYPAFASFLSLSPDGQFAVIDTWIQAKNLPKEWERYSFGEDDYVKAYFHVPDGSTGSPFDRYLLVNLTTKSAVPLWNGPRVHDGFLDIQWAEDRRTIALKGVYLPLTGEVSVGSETRLKEKFDVRVDVNSLSWSLEDPVFEEHSTPLAPSLKVTVQEDINTPPKVYGEDLVSHQKRLILDPNPQLRNVSLGRVDVISWEVRGICVKAGLYLPTNYDSGTRYPLVIQTHGFQDDRFSMDGRNEWSSGFAARLLAARGIAVLQTYDFCDPADHARVGQDKDLGNNELESFRTFSGLVYESAIHELDRRGFIDPGHVGISGFSRTVWFVDYALTHTNVPFAAALLTDGIDAGYFSYLAFGIQEFAEDNGGEEPFGEHGLGMWLKEAPGFNLDKVRTPIRIVCLNMGSDLLESWEWWAGLKFQKKPVDMIAIPDGSHILERPKDRKLAMESMADWFEFWLLGREHDKPEDPGQYKRWEHLRELQDSRDKDVGQTHADPIKPN
jgi:dipeptidyl aminopeptidase/acylaminoacyl peptidase